MIPLMNSTGINTAASEMVMDRMVKPISFAPSNAACHARLPHFHVADDVFEHDDGIVHDEGHGERERHEREVVQRVAEQRHGRKGADDRHRQRQAGNYGRRDISQKKENDQNDQHDRQQQGEFHVIDRIADGLGAVDQDAQVHRGRQQFAEGGRSWSLMESTTCTVLVPGCFWTARMMERISDPPLLNHAADLVVLYAVDHLPQLLQANGRAVAIGHHKLPYCSASRELTCRLTV